MVIGEHRHMKLLLAPLQASTLDRGARKSGAVGVK